MQKLEKITDAALREKLTSAHAQLRANQPTDAVRTIVDAFLSMLQTKPEILDVTVPVRGRSMPLVMRWPMLGANLDLASVRAREPKIDITRDRFAMSEALTYFEFTVDTAIEQGL